MPWILPNEWTGDTTNKKYGEETLLGPGIPAARKQIEELGVTSWIGLTTGYWYEYSLGGLEWRYGFDFKKRSFTFFDDGEIPINHPRGHNMVVALPVYSLEGETGQP